MVEKPEAIYGEVQGVVAYWYPEMDMDIWVKPILEKAEKWDEWLKLWPMLLDKSRLEELIDKENRLEAVREFVLSRRQDIEKDIENFGGLKPVLNYFLEEGEG